MGDLAAASDAGWPDATMAMSATATDGAAGAVCDCGTPPTCELRSCKGSSCSDSNAELGAPCIRASNAAGVCNGSGSCVECNENPDCAGNVDGIDDCHEATCINNVCTTGVKLWARCGANNVCNREGVCAASCGNGHFESEIEECDPTAGSDTWSCNRNTCRLTNLSASTSYHPCSGPSDCASGETCKSTGILIGLVACIPTCTATPALSCPIPPGYTTWIFGGEPACDDRNRDCFVLCSSNADCPASVTCSGGVCYNPYELR
jgi:hypothetical protein